MKAKGKATREFLATDETVSVIAEFAQGWRTLERDQRHIVIEAGILTQEMIEVLSIEPSADGKERFMQVLRACTTSLYLRQVAGQWAGALLGGAELSSITTFKELAKAAKEGNEKIGVKPRGRVKAEASQTVKALDVADIWPALEAVMGTASGRSKVREVLNRHGFEMVALADAKIMDEQRTATAAAASKPQARSLRKAA